ncbi:response regulator transcription factor [Aliarcobacter butzleri]|uniref:response regulator transcription factor n=1 Tax=Aliarcobacter butzleri TaxID=28197 RepID=UPI001ED9FFC7|nr:response regulator transcription factor [Aliarcobacter butzleri]MCG3706693.1 response regulator transcription factor [Aliarcobacter butzleri]MCT7570773.1 response regulator transcription factor [Aliarcobacter butzleri]
MIEQMYPYKILFVEDENAIRENYITYLKMFFNEVHEASDGEEAYKFYELHKPDILIVDINIPKMNGLELLKKIRQNDMTTKAIIMTAHSDNSFLFEAVTLKLTKYLVKPVNRKDLKDALELVIDELLNFDIQSIQKIELPENYSWDLTIKELKHYNKIVDLTNKEKLFLDLLLSKKNKVFSYDDIFEYVWNFEDEINLNGLKNLVKRLRKKVPENLILNVFNEGYKINI